MSTPVSKINQLGQKQKSQVKLNENRFTSNPSTATSSPMQGGLMQNLSKSLRLLPTVESLHLHKEDAEEKKKIDLLFNMSKSFLGCGVDELLRSICDHVEYRLARTKWSFDLSVAYSATALSVRDRMIELWNDTNRVFHERKPKRLYYLSIEFLIGRLLRSNVLSLGLENDYTTALKNIGIKMEKVVEEELDMALGNGGLGRLAACFLDSMASLRLPCWGYGLRYQYGMFKQKISPEGDQLELPDYWLENGCPWEIQRNDVKYTIHFYGWVEEQHHWVPQTKTHQEKRLKQKPKIVAGDGAPVPPPIPALAKDDDYEIIDVSETVQVEVSPPTHIWHSGQEVLARANDVPIAGFDTMNVINLRLWDSIPAREFDFSSFNKGSYDDAVRTKQNAELITQVLYPNDSFYSGKELRLKQQYLFVSASLQDIIRRTLALDVPFTQFPEQIIMQCNDTHPVLAIPEFLRILIDIHGLTFDQAWPITQGCFAYTNHTVLPEALEKWPVDLLLNVLPRHLQLIYEINFRFLESIKGKFPHLVTDLSIVEESPIKQIRMANLAIVTSRKVNGVAAIHSQILRDTLFNNFYQVFPEKFLNVTNGVTQRRWLLECNTPLANLYTKYAGTSKWTVQYRHLRAIESKITPRLISEFIEVRLLAKAKLAKIIKEETGYTVDPTALFDVQVKRLHEYKRQTLNILRCVHEYLRILALGVNAENIPKKVIIFGGKAAPGYFMAKKTIRLISAIGQVVNNDPRVKDRLKVVFIPNYNVSLAQNIIPAADISQHISTAGYEASGTSCMKFCMNGALLLGTWDGANIEIVEQTGEEQAYLFGLKAEEINRARELRHSPSYSFDPRLANVLSEIERGRFGNPDEYKAITGSVRNGDHYLVASDFADYVATHERIEQDWANQDEWFRRAILTSIHMDKFSSDRSIIDYSEKIWGIKPCIVPKPIPNEEV